jgi:hypothetical protein
MIKELCSIPESNAYDCFKDCRNTGSGVLMQEEAISKEILST